MSNEISDFDGIQMRIRGDGRTYAFNIQPQTIREDDIHQTFIHTRGGPLWEIVRVITLMIEPQWIYFLSKRLKSKGISFKYFSLKCRQPTQKKEELMMD